MKRLVKRSALAVAAVAALTVPAFAQFGLGGGQERDRTRYTEEQRRTEKEVEKAYRDAIQNTRGAATETYDPWRNIRPQSETTAKKSSR
jgi:hypothetical protein